MTQQSNGNGAPPGANVNIQGGAAIVAPISAFENGVPPNALVVLPLSKPTDEMIGLLEKGPVAVTQEQMWQLLGFNGPAVQVQDDQGRPIAIGLEDLLAGLDKHWTDNQDDLNRGRLYAQKLLEHQRWERAEAVLAKVVAKGGLNGDDWMALGVTQLNLKKLDKAESTLKGAQNIMKKNPYPSLHLAKVYAEKGDKAAQRAATEKAIEIEPQAVDAWAYLFHVIQESDGEPAAISAVEALAAKEPYAKTAAPFIAIQGFYAGNEEKREDAISFAKKAVERNADDPLALLCLSALYGQAGDLDKVIALLQPHEPKMMRDVRLAHNYLQALFQGGQRDKVTRLLNALAGSPEKEVKQFAIEQSRQIAEILRQEQAQLASVMSKALPRRGPRDVPGPDPDHWLHRLTASEWIAAATGELERASAAFARGDAKAGIVGAKRAAGMALNGALVVEPDDRWGRTYIEHVQALSEDERVPPAVREAAKTVMSAKPPGGPLLALRSKKGEDAAVDAARTVMAHALARVVHHGA